MSEPACGHCISSAVVLARPERADEVAARIMRLGAEIGAIQDGRIVVVLEGPSPGALGTLLGAIGGLDGVLAANMVFEHIEEDRCQMS